MTANATDLAEVLRFTKYKNRTKDLVLIVASIGTTGQHRVVCTTWRAYVSGPSSRYKLCGASMTGDMQYTDRAIHYHDLPPSVVAALRFLVTYIDGRSLSLYFKRPRFNITKM